jgi:hypothetical protein
MPALPAIRDAAGRRRDHAWVHLSPGTSTTTALAPPRSARTPARGPWRVVATTSVIAGFTVGGAGVVLDGCETLLWSRDVYSFDSLQLGVIVLLVAGCGGLLVRGALRTLAWLVLLVGPIVAFATLPLWCRFSYPVEVLRELPLPDGRTVTACRVHTAAFQDDFLAVRVERRGHGLWRVHYLARGPLGDVTMALVDPGHVHVHFTPAPGSGPGGPSDRLLTIPPR